MNEILIRQFLGKPKQSFECNAILEQMIQFAHLMMINATHLMQQGTYQNDNKANSTFSDS